MALTSYISLVVNPFIWQEPIQFVTWLITTFYQVAILTGMHCFLSVSSLLYAKADSLRKGNERILDNFEEGVIILEEDTGNVSFTNKSAKAFKALKNDSFLTH